MSSPSEMATLNSDITRQLLWDSRGFILSQLSLASLQRGADILMIAGITTGQALRSTWSPLFQMIAAMCATTGADALGIGARRTESIPEVFQDLTSKAVCCGDFILLLAKPVRILLNELSILIREGI